MMYIDEFNEMTGTRYTKESFIKLFNQYFPNGDGKSKESYDANYKKMFDHALRFAVRSYVFSSDDNTDVKKVADGLDTLFAEQIDDYNKLIDKRGKSLSKIHYIQNAGFSRSEINDKLYNCLDDMPRTTFDEEKICLNSKLKSGETLSDDNVFKRVTFDRINEILIDKDFTRDDKLEHSVDVIKLMQNRLNSHEKNYKISHPLKYADEKKSIDSNMSLIENGGFSSKEIEERLSSPEKPSKLFSKIEESINEVSKANETTSKEFDFRKQLAELTGEMGHAKRSMEINNNTVIKKDINLKK